MDTKIQLPSALCQLVETLEGAGYSAYFVGGCVRDALLGKQATDYDVATSATPDKVTDLFSGYKVIPTGVKHGTVTVIYEGFTVEITTFRKDGVYTDCRHPQSVVFSDSIRDDAARRDFTVNALCYSPTEGVLDFYGGTEDLKKGIIRCVGDPDLRFHEDALRILRALRFAARLGFTIDNHTAKAMHSCKGLISNVSAERVFSELCGFFSAGGAVSVVKEHHSILFTAIATEGVTDIENLCDYLGKVPCGYRLPLFLALCGGSVNGAMNVIKKLKPDNATKDLVYAMSNAIHSTAFDTPYNTACTARRFGVETVGVMCNVAAFGGQKVYNGAYEQIDRIKTQALPLSVKELKVNGKDIIDNKIAVGEGIGKVLEHLFKSVHLGTENTKSVLLAKAKEYVCFNEREM